MTSRGASTRIATREEPIRARVGRDQGSAPKAGHPRVREELADHHGIVPRGDQAQPPPAMATAKTQPSQNQPLRRD